MAVGQLDLAGNEQRLDQEMAAQFGRAEMAHGLGMANLPDFDGHYYLFSATNQRNRAGSQSDRPGTYVTSSSTAMLAPRNGQIVFMASPIVIFPTAQPTKSTEPTGGVLRPMPALR